MGLAQRGQEGDRLPTIRALMRQFGLSQARVQAVLAELHERGAIIAEVGRGTFLAGPGLIGEISAPDAPAEVGRSVLILRRTVATRRARMVLEEVGRRLAASGHRTLEIGYSDAPHACRVLRTLPRFDACLLSSAFEPMPIEMLAALRRKAAAVVVDGAWLTGADIDSIGFEWGASVEQAIATLRAAGHARIALATTARPFLANILGLHRYDALRQRSDGAALLPPILLDLLPTDGLAAAIVAALAALEAPPTALIAWGIEDGEAFRAVLEEAGFPVPDRLSVILLGRTDIPEEGAGFFDVVGYRTDAQCDAVHAALLRRWDHPDAPHTLRLMPVHARDARSVAAPPPASRRRGS
jgi:DNA-binding LacI/PurR family transcriptional regulator